jgi:hypothetical protein
MSEYQYYEFVAVDRPLTRNEMAELRSRSSRATITATGFTNEYNWGDLKADPDDWMRRYFDAFVYTANWYSCRLALRLPRDAFNKAELKRFATKNALEIDDSGTHWIINWLLDEGQDYDRFGMETGQGWMGRLIPLRDELLRGDLRPLYLGWLAGVNAGEVDDEAVEPEVPPGMSQLSAAQQALAEFLEIDPDLLAAAAAGSPSTLASADDDRIDAWLADLAPGEMRPMLKLLLYGQSQQAERQIKSRFLAWQKKNAQRPAASARLRTVAELHSLASEAEQHRLQREAKERTRKEAADKKKREAYLQTLAADVDRCWNEIDQQAEGGKAAAYDAALRAIVDLADAYALAGKTRAFDKALRSFMARHGNRGALVRRLVEAGLWQK